MTTLPAPLPGNKNQPKEQFKHSRPVDITSNTKISPVTNEISISWIHPCLPHNPNSIDYNKKFCFTLCLVNKLSSEDLINKVKAKGIKAAEFTQSIIKDKLRDEDIEIATTSLRASLMCPLGKMRLKLPGRSINCTHIQCFDMSLFLLMNEKKPTWTCPVCDKKLAFDSLVIDGLFTDILASDASIAVSEVQFDLVNNLIEWSPVVKEEHKSQESSQLSINNEPIPSCSSQVLKRRHSTDEPEEPLSQAKQSKQSDHEVIELGSTTEDDDNSSQTVICPPRHPQPPPQPQEPMLTVIDLSDDDDSGPPATVSQTIPRYRPRNSLSSQNAFSFQSIDYDFCTRSLPTASRYTNPSFVSARDALYSSFLEGITTDSLETGLFPSTLSSASSSSTLSMSNSFTDRSPVSSGSDTHVEDNDDITIID